MDEQSPGSSVTKEDGKKKNGGNSSIAGKRSTTLRSLINFFEPKSKVGKAKPQNLVNDLSQPEQDSEKGIQARTYKTRHDREIVDLNKVEVEVKKPSRIQSLKNFFEPNSKVSKARPQNIVNDLSQPAGQVSEKACTHKTRHDKEIVDLLSKLKVEGTVLEELHLPNISLSDDVVMKAVLDFLRPLTKVKRLTLKQCDLSSVAIQALCSGLSNLKISELDLSGNKNLGHDISALRVIVRGCNVKILNVSECFTIAQIQILTRKLKGTQIEGLDVSLGKGTKVQLLAGKLTLDTQAKSRRRSMLPAHNGAKITEKASLAELIIGLLPHVTRHLKIHNWELSFDDIIQIRERMDKDGLLGLVITHGSKGQLSISSSILAAISMKVGPAGGTLTFGSCTVKIPGDAIRTKTDIKVSLKSDATDCPAGYHRVFPVIQCEPSGLKLKEPMKISVNSCVEKESCTEDESDILWRKNSSSEWKKLKTVPQSGRSIEYECDRFSDHLIAKTEDKYTDSVIWLRNYVFYQGPNYKISVCLDESTTADALHSQYVAAQYKSIFPMGKKMTAQIGEEIRVKMSVLENEYFAFNPSDGRTVSIDTGFRDCEKYVRLTPSETEDVGSLRIQYLAEIQGKNMIEDGEFVVSVTKRSGNVQYINGNFVGMGSARMEVHQSDSINAATAFNDTIHETTLKGYNPRMLENSKDTLLRAKEIAKEMKRGKTDARRIFVTAANETRERRYLVACVCYYSGCHLFQNTDEVDSIENIAACVKGMSDAIREGKEIETTVVKRIIPLIEEVVDLIDVSQERRPSSWVVAKADCLHNLSFCYRRCGMAVEARDVVLEAINILEEKLDHPEECRVYLDCKGLLHSA